MITSIRMLAVGAVGLVMMGLSTTAHAEASKSWCTEKDIQTALCQKGDIAIVRTQAVYLYCNFYREIVKASDSLTFCMYSGSKRRQRGMGR
ncbi:MAG: hypothetical protein HQL50_02210 [Magnetococcales bacterium]|nr:hypothetical protein [Magnetococcales bacterium]